MIGSYIASQIDEEFKRKKYYSKKERQRCKEITCNRCMFNAVCETGKQIIIKEEVKNEG